MFDRNTELIEERYVLSMGRIRRIEEEKTVPAPFDDFFCRMKRFICELDEADALLRTKPGEEPAMPRRQEQIHHMHEDILPDHYAQSYGNPAYAVHMLGPDCGRELCFLYAFLRKMPGYCSAGRLEAVVIRLELFLEIYNRFEQTPLPDGQEIRKILHWFVSDSLDVLVPERLYLELHSTCAGDPGMRGRGLFCEEPDLQYTADHKEDAAVYLDRRFLNRYLAVLRRVCDSREIQPGTPAEIPAVSAAQRRNPAVRPQPEALAFSEKQRELAAELEKEQMKITGCCGSILI